MSARWLVVRLVLAGLAVAAVGLGVWSLTGNLSSGAAWAGAASLLCGFAQLALSGVEYLRRSEQPRFDAVGLADNLAQIVEAEWMGEVVARHLRDPRVLPLSWSSFGVGLDRQPGRVVRDRLAGRMDGRFDEVIGQLADGYRQTPRGRLVVVGEPGAGKTVLTILLTLGLLKSRARGAAVPVLLSASSWDPIREGLDDWVVRTLADFYYAGRSEIPRRLLDHRLLVPILDGLDEIPESGRRGAIRALNHAIGADHPVVVTCRTTEYAEVITDGAPTLRQAPVVRVMPVPAEDVIGYLSQVDWPDGTVWDGVYADVRAQPQGPVASALSTPLMLAQARTVYQRLGGDPAGLLDTGRFDCRHAVEDHLTDRVIDAAYAADRLPSGEPARETRPRWTAQQARPWLVFLAVYLHRYRERDLAWWQLSQRMLSPWVAPGIGITGGLTFMAVVSTWITAMDDSPINDGQALAFGAVVGATFTILAIVVLYAGAGRAPGRLSFATRGSLARLRRGFITGTALFAVLAVPVLLVVAVVTWLSSGWSLGFIDDYMQAAAGVVAVAGVIGVALAIHNWLDAPPARAAQASPQGFLRQDRRSSLVSAAIAGAVLGITVFPALTTALILGSLTSQLLTGWPGWPGRPNVIETVSSRWDGAFLGLDPGSWLMVIGTFCVIPGVLFALLILLTRAWPRFMLTLALLAIRGRLPLRLMDFLSDARDRQLLRQSGGAYQFRHIRLQERLADQTTASTDLRSRAAPATVRLHRSRYRRPLLTLTATVVVLTVAIVGIAHLPQDTSRITLTGHTGAVNRAVFSPDGRIVATGDDDTAQLWDSATGRPIGSPLTVQTRMTYLGFSPDGRTVVAGDDDTAELWDTTSGRPIATLAGHIAFRPHSPIPTVATASGDGHVRLWNTGTGQLLQTLDNGPTGVVDVVAFSPDGKTLTVGSSGLGDDTVQLRDVATGHLIATLTRHLIVGGQTSPDHDVRFSSDGKTVTTVGGDGTVRLWDAASGQLMATRTLDADNLTTVVLLDPTGQTVAIVNDQRGTIRLLNVVSGQILDLDGEDLTDPVFSPDGRNFAALSCDAISLWNTTTGHQLIATAYGHRAFCSGNFAKFNSDGTTVANSTLDGTVLLWNTASGQLITTLTGHTDHVNDVAFSPDGRTVVTASDDHTAKLWDVPTPQR